MSLPTRGAWIEINTQVYAYMLTMSLPTRGAWIEILVGTGIGIFSAVAPHTGSVD